MGGPGWSGATTRVASATRSRVKCQPCRLDHADRTCFQTVHNGNIYGEQTSCDFVTPVAASRQPVPPQISVGSHKTKGGPGWSAATTRVATATRSRVKCQPCRLDHADRTCFRTVPNGNAYGKQTSCASGTLVAAPRQPVPPRSRFPAASPIPPLSYKTAAFPGAGLRALS